MQHPTTEQLIDYVHGALPPEADAQLFAHLDDCTICRSEYAAEIALTELLRTQAASEERELPPMLKASIWQAIRKSEPSTIERLRAWLRPAYAIPVAVALLAGAFFAPAYLHGSHANAPESIEAAYYLQDHAAMNGAVPFGDHSGATSSEFEMTSSVDQTAVIPVPIVHTADATH
ncbi:MAG: zf-HC2 domain-containing protein [Candidatus Eremiobacteraeota bacterium]|nr:zf-HC2 domain-containing protein [Candidatus Eremiobacteraeota bacterium]